ncbi:hypothetical protein ACOSP7_003566 [Xanthoceras sorbifolium]
MRLCSSERRWATRLCKHAAQLQNGDREPRKRAAAAAKKVSSSGERRKSELRPRAAVRQRARYRADRQVEAASERLCWWSERLWSGGAAVLVERAAVVEGSEAASGSW